MGSPLAPDSPGRVGGPRKRLRAKARERNGWRLGLLLVASVAAASCGRAPIPAGHRAIVDLAAELAVAEVRRETAVVDFGTTAARPHLVSGWGWKQKRGDGSTFVWSVGYASEIRFQLVRPRDLTLELTGWTAAAEAPEGRRVDLELNGFRWGELMVQPSRRSYRLEVPAERLVAGENRLVFHHPWATRPGRAAGSGRSRRLAVAWETLRIRGAIGSSGLPTAGAADGAKALSIPVGTEITYFLAVPADALLAWNEGPRAGSGRVVVEVQEEGGTARALPAARGRGDARVAPLALTGSGPQLIRLTLRAVPGETPGGGGNVVLIDPAIWSPPPATAGPGDARPPIEPGSRASPSARRHLVLFLVDTLRADHVGAYGARDRSLTPRLDRFAEGAIVFEDAVAQTSWTRPAVATVLTGLSPRQHGVTTLDDRLPDEATTLAELLKREGYHTAAWSSNAHVTARTGLAQGFDEFVYLPDLPRSASIVEQALAWLDRRPGGDGEAAPLFLYLHALDPHAPYDPPDELRRRFAPDASPEAGTIAYLRRIYASAAGERRRLMESIPGLYAGEVAAIDASFAALVDGLARRGILDDTVVVFLADHGEGLDEHGHLGHGADLYRESTAIPWILRVPGSPPGRIASTAQQIDFLPTVLGALDLEVPPGLPGVDLVRATAAGPAEPRPAFSHLDYARRRGIGVVLGDWKLVEPLSRGFGRGPELYHRVRDPGETENLVAENPVRAGYLRSLIRRHLREVSEADAAAATLDAESRANLEALGYL